MTTKLIQQEANRYLRDEAVKAHYNGEGAKSRHLAAIALRNEKNNSDSSMLQFRDLFWAFSLLIHWMIDRQDFDHIIKPAWYAFGERQKPSIGNSDNASKPNHEKISPIAQNSKDHWCTLIQYLLDALTHSNINLDNSFKQLAEIEKKGRRRRKKELELLE